MNLYFKGQLQVFFLFLPMPFLIDVKKWSGHKGKSWKSLDEITIWMTEFHPALSHMSDHFSSKKRTKADTHVQLVSIS